MNVGFTYRTQHWVLQKRNDNIERRLLIQNRWIDMD